MHDKKINFSKYIVILRPRKSHRINFLLQIVSAVTIHQIMTHILITATGDSGNFISQSTRVIEYAARVMATRSALERTNVFQLLMNLFEN